MTWEWIAFVAIAALWTLGLQLIYAWKEVRMIQRMPDDQLRKLQSR